MAFPFPTFPIQGSRLVSEFRGDYNQMLDAILQAFTGPDEPSPTFAGMFWADTSVDPKLLKQRNTGNTGWVIRAQVDADYGGVLPLTGGTMTGDVAMGGNAITGLPLGSGDAAARYADLAAYAPLTGATFTGSPPELPAVDPTTDNQAARKSYVDDRAIAGGAYTGQITMSTPPTALTHVTTKTYVDGALDLNNHDGSSGRGPVLQGANIGASGRDLGDRLQADGSGGVEWTAGNPMTIFDKPVLGVRGTFGTLGWTRTEMVWNTLDLGHVVPETAKHALISVNSGTRYWETWPIWHRPAGSSSGLPPGGGGGATLQALQYPTAFPGFTPLDQEDYASMEAPMALPWTLASGKSMQLANHKFWVRLEYAEKEVQLAFGMWPGPIWADTSHKWSASGENPVMAIYVFGWN